MTSLLFLSVFSKNRKEHFILTAVIVVFQQLDEQLEHDLLL